MQHTWTRAVGAAALATALAVGTAGCSDGDGGSVSSAASAAASKASEVLSSATAAAQRQLDEIKDGVDVASDVQLGTPAADADGKSAVKVTARNTADSAKSLAVQVNFNDASGNLLDTVVVTVQDVPAGQSKDATAVSNRKLSGEVKAAVGKAVRY
ncbi:FxLYD domain-containing protein [Streptomyces sp. NBC_00249]|uniref:FxLYD domain-containing protein n=1 Tax=Streptomyces sp. NBC_00249 TaxID=2975690 RepID=UPI00224D7C01|nr:FxLYD domain-containing protein [Streptomyces sp. NBC_00249]MCX5192857.1 FxLYD domain-containing protein [Streptomyces sp. NBC_00249]